MVFIELESPHECLGRVTFRIVKYPFQLGVHAKLLPILQLRTTSVLLHRPCLKIEPINLHSWNEKHMLHDMQICDWLGF